MRRSVSGGAEVDACVSRKTPSRLFVLYSPCEGLERPGVSMISLERVLEVLRAALSPPSPHPHKAGQAPAVYAFRVRPRLQILPCPEKLNLGDTRLLCLEPTRVWCGTIRARVFTLSGGGGDERCRQ